MLASSANVNLFSLRLASKGASAIVSQEPVEEGDRLLQQAFQAIVDRKWNDAHSATDASLALGNLSPAFAPLAYNLRATFSFLRGDGEWMNTIFAIPMHWEMQRLTIAVMLSRDGLRGLGKVTRAGSQ